MKNTVTKKKDTKLVKTVVPFPLAKNTAETSPHQDSNKIYIQSISILKENNQKQIKQNSHTIQTPFMSKTN